MSIRVRIDGREMVVQRRHYVISKTKQLRQFGYSNLQESEVEKQIDLILLGKSLGDGLSVIGGFMEDEIILEKELKKK